MNRAPALIKLIAKELVTTARIELATPSLGSKGTAVINEFLSIEFLWSSVNLMFIKFTVFPVVFQALDYLSDFSSLDSSILLRPSICTTSSRPLKSSASIET